MIRFDTASETAEHKSAEGNDFLTIHPKSELSDKGIADFISGEIEKARADAILEPYDELLEEIYDVSEDDISIDYEVSDQVKDILSKFQRLKWYLMDDDARLETVKKLVDTVGDELGIKDKPKIKITEENEDFYGAYDPEKNTIILNKKGFIDPKELVDTITHELRHAYQNMCAEKLETHEDALFRVNLENYISPKQGSDGEYLNFTDYQNQYVEVDARAFADKFTEAMK